MVLVINIYSPTSMNSRFDSTAASTRSTHLALCLGSQEMSRRQPMPDFILANGRTLIVAGEGNNQIGMNVS